MQNEVKTISLAMPFGMSGVNCYLVEAGDGFVLIDTGSTNRRAELLEELARAGCKPGLLKLIVVTHGDFDHTGNAAYLRSAFGAKIAMHRDDAGMAERGDMFDGRKKPNFLIRALIPLFARLGPADRFAPDILLEDGHELSEYGLEARVISLPGHSRGSVGLLTAGGDLFCGDLLENRKRPAPTGLVDDAAALQASAASLAQMGIGTVYPGHGGPFAMAEYLRSGAAAS